jgi:hypothetical protein
MDCNTIPSPFLLTTCAIPPSSEMRCLCNRNLESGRMQNKPPLSARRLAVAAPTHQDDRAKPMLRSSAELRENEVLRNSPLTQSATGHQTSMGFARRGRTESDKRKKEEARAVRLALLEVPIDTARIEAATSFAQQSYRPVTQAAIEVLKPSAPSTSTQLVS